MHESKEKILENARGYLGEIIGKITDKKEEISESVRKTEARNKFISERDRIIEAEVYKYNKKREGELESLSSSPYFFKCLVKYENNSETEEVYIGKFNFSEEKIYSWFSPVSKLRFEDIGEFGFELPGEKIKKGEMLRKDQFMITGGKIVYMASEEVDEPRRLIYQEHLSNRKSGFILPEIVEKMEKKQDEVIRADYRGSFLISGPAGSGKTTLALHRVAYLAQSPDTNEIFPGYTMIVFVQDESTSEYFKSILPQLGIDDVAITTYYRWALRILNLEEYKYVYRYGSSEKEKDEYEFYKNNALKENREIYFGGHENILKETYKDYLNEDHRNILEKQLEENILDRFDIAVLMRAYLNKNGRFKTEEKCLVQMKNGELKTDRRFFPVEYSLIIVDETQNYLAEEIAAIKTCVSSKTNSILYVGDLAQQTKLGTLRDWSDADEEFGEGRKVVLEKVYRNTRAILEYVKKRGYDIEIPEGIKDGKAVEEIEINAEKIENRIQEIIEKNKEDIIGIISRDEKDLDLLKNKFAGVNNIHVLTINEAQGVEFDTVIFIENNKSEFGYEEELIKEKEKVDRDLTYVALTRAMERMYVLIF